MFSEIQLEQKEDYEYDLEGIDLQNHFLMIDSYEGIYIYYDIYRFIISDEFIKSENLSLIEENESCPLLILKIEQKIEIQNIINFNN
jgi:hypothetical protein